MSAVAYVPVFRTAPREAFISVAGGIPEVHMRQVPLAVSSIDHVTGYGNVTEMRVWGDIDPGFLPSIFGPEQGDSRWIPFSPVQTLVLSAGDGEKVINAQIRNGSRFETSVMTDEIVLKATPHVTILWMEDKRVPSGSSDVAMRWSASHDATASRLMVAPHAEATMDECALLNESGALTAGMARYELVDVAHLIAADIHPTQSGKKVIKVFAEIDGVWVS